MVLPFYKGKNREPREPRKPVFGWLPNKVRNHSIAWAGEFVGYDFEMGHNRGSYWWPKR